MTTIKPRRTVLLGALTAAFTSSIAGAALAQAPPPSCERYIAAAARRYEIPLAVFYAVGLQETGGPRGLQPFTMNIDGRSVASDSLAAALAKYRAATGGGSRLVDVGCMQINVRYHGGDFGSIEAMFDPARNVDYAARFLRELKAREKTWTLAVARYNAGPDNDPAQKRYVCGVIAKMVASGFGSWTPNAVAFCAPPAARAAVAAPH